MIETYLLEYFLTLVKEGNTLKAGEKLHVSQPSVTRAIQKLEEELNLPLFIRKPNKLILNENGQILAEYIKDAVSINKRIVEKAEELRKKSLNINIVMTAPGPTLKYPNFFFFHQKDNPYTMEIKPEDECIKSVLNGLSDVGFINNVVPLPNDFFIEKVFEEKLYVSLTKEHFLAKKTNGLYFKDLDNQSFLVARDLGIWDKIVKSHLKNSRFLRQNMDDLYEIVSSSSIPSFVTNISLKFRDETNRVFIPILDEDAKKTFYAICKNENIKLLNIIKHLD